MKSKLVLVAAAALSTAVAAQSTPAGANAGNPASAGGSVRSVQPQYTQSMQQLQQSAQRLRESIQALAQQSPGPQRDQALTNAHQALLSTQQAMLKLPPELRSTGTVSNADYDGAVKKLMQSADSLRQSIQEMAQQPAGERRNSAIESAHRALRETQMAMIDAYASGTSRTQSMGAAAAGGQQPVQELREDSREVSKAARQGAIDARQRQQAGPGAPAD